MRLSCYGEVLTASIYLLIFFFRLISLDLLWVNIGPSESAIQNLAAKASGLTKADTDVLSAKGSLVSESDGSRSKSEAPNKIVDETEDEWVLNDVKNKTPEQILNFLATQPLGKFRYDDVLI